MMIQKKNENAIQLKILIDEEDDTESHIHTVGLTGKDTGIGGVKLATQESKQDVDDGRGRGVHYLDVVVQKQMVVDYFQSCRTSTW